VINAEFVGLMQNLVKNPTEILQK